MTSCFSTYGLIFLSDFFLIVSLSFVTIGYAISILWIFKKNIKKYKSLTINLSVVIIPIIIWSYLYRFIIK